jgi:acyl-coenzyme A thioesterase PaaI-like protein
MPTITEVLGARPLSEDACAFHIGTDLHGAFGGVFGGLLAAACLQTARRAAPGRVPNALDCRFVRGLRRPDATASATVLHAGRSLTNVSVDLVDPDGKLCTRSTVSLVEPSALQPVQRPSPAHEPWMEHADAKPWPPVAPIVAALDSRFVSDDADGDPIAVVVPWDELTWPAESACIALDMAVGPPAGRAGAGQNVGTPNPDLSCRFAGDVTSKILVGVGRLLRADGGVAAIALEAWSDDQLVANGISTALMVPS